MKKKGVLLLAIASCVCQMVSAQNITKDIDLYLRGGVFGLINSGYGFGIGGEKSFGENENNRWSIDLNYHKVSEGVDVVHAVIQEKNYYLGINYKRDLLESKLSGFNPYIGLGLLGGYKYSYNDNDVIIPKHSFNCGIKPFAGLEYRLNNAIGLFSEISWIFDGSSYLNASIGVKYRLQNN